MDWISRKLTASVTEKISDFLGEPQQNVENCHAKKAVNNFGYLVQQGKQAMKVLKDNLIKDGITGDMPQ
jgi:hypothetical protein